VSYVTGIIGYFMMFLTFMGFGAREVKEGEDPVTPGLVYWGLTFLSYGIYFG
jgi:RING finger protein 121